MCSISGCERKARSRGWCDLHYNRWWRTGDPNGFKSEIAKRVSEAMLDYSAYFWTRVHKIPGDGCWIWLGNRDKKTGYSHISARRPDGSSYSSAYVWAWEQENGRVPQGEQLDHFVCDNPRCVRPSHLRPTTPRENTLRGDTPAARNLAKTHCKWGHPFSGENLYVTPQGRRVCRICDREKVKRYQQRQKDLQ